MVYGALCAVLVIFCKFQTISKQICRKNVITVKKINTSYRFPFGIFSMQFKTCDTMFLSDNMLFENLKQSFLHRHKFSVSLIFMLSPQTQL